ncbi:unnamed protein product [Ilex paraguariensis]|uniref:Uncharacterized protein n=1 Tax=Ilex paraguariensis TaxID=185542 RepID=A0ABC8RTY9_9AQUA
MNTKTYLPKNENEMEMPRSNLQEINQLRQQNDRQYFRNSGMPVYVMDPSPATTQVVEQYHVLHIQLSCSQDFEVRKPQDYPFHLIFLNPPESHTITLFRELWPVYEAVSLGAFRTPTLQ